MAIDKKISELAFGKNIRNNFLPIVENGVNKRLYLQTLSKRFDILNKTQDYNIKQVDYRNLIIGNCNQNPYGDLNLYLPSGADAIIGYPYSAQHGIYQGFVKVNVKAGSGNKILYKGQQLDYFLLYSSGQKVGFVWNGNYWIPKKETDIIMNINWFKISDHTNRHVGNALTYDNKSAAISLTGQVITEEISGFSAVVIYDDTVNSILYYYELSTGFTFFTNNRELTSSSGITCDVNEASGSNLNIDYNLYDGSGLNIDNKKIRLFYHATGGDMDNSQELILYFRNVTSILGLHPWQIDEFQTKLQTGTGGSGSIIADDGSGNNLDTDDVFFKTKVII